MADVSLPQLSSIISRVSADISPTGISPSVQQAFDKARTGINEDFSTQGRADQAYLGQAFAQAGGIYGPHQVDDAKVRAAQALDLERGKAMQRLNFQESEAGLSQFNTLMNLLGGGAGAALNLAGGFSGAQAQAIGGMSNQSPGWGALGGAASGASVGSAFGPYGAVLGGVLGGLGGYFGSGG